MAYTYDEDTGEWYDDGAAESDETADTGLTAPASVTAAPSEDDQRFEEDWQDMLNGGMTIDEIAAQYPDRAGSSLYDQILAGGKSAVNWVLQKGGDAVKAAVTKPDGSIDYAKLAGIGVGMLSYGSAGKAPAASGYQGSIPKLTAARAAVPGTYDPNREAGSGGQRYFSDVLYGDTGSVVERAAKARAQAAELAARNKANGANRAPLSLNLRPPKSTETMGATPPRPAAGIAGLPTGGASGASNTDSRGFTTGGGGLGGFDSAGAIAAISAQIQQELGGIKTDKDLDAYLLRTGHTPEQLANATGYRAEDIAARMTNAFKNSGQSTQEWLASAYAPTSQQSPVAGAVIGGSSPAVPSPSASGIMDTLNSFTSDAQLNDFFANTNMSAQQLAAESGYNAADIQARLDAAQGDSGWGSAYNPESYFFFAKGGNVPSGLASLPQDTIYNSKEPRYLKGASNGQADEIKTTIDGHTPAALSHGEFVIPADVVGALGGGNSDAGAKTLYSMMDRVRQQATGSKQQMKAVNHGRVLPA